MPLRTQDYPERTPVALYDLTNHVAIVTGANHGIGAATARVLAGCGAGVLVTYFRLEDAHEPSLPQAYFRERASNADHVVAEIHSKGGTATAVEADLADPETPRRLFDTAEAELGPVDILVNNASGWLADTFTATTHDEFGRALARVSSKTFDRQFAVDARGAAALIAEFARRHVDRGATWGRIIGLTSGGPGGFPGEVSYGAAKAALESYTMSAASELVGVGVTANLVHPPVTDTGWVTAEVRRRVSEHPDHMRIVDPEEVARVIACLASDEARLISGNVLRLR